MAERDRTKRERSGWFEAINYLYSVAKSDLGLIISTIGSAVIIINIVDANIDLSFTLIFESVWIEYTRIRDAFFYHIAPFQLSPLQRDIFFLLILVVATHYRAWMISLRELEEYNECNWAYILFLFLITFSMTVRTPIIYVYIWLNSRESFLRYPIDWFEKLISLVTFYLPFLFNLPFLYVCKYFSKRRGLDKIVKSNIDAALSYDQRQKYRSNFAEDIRNMDIGIRHGSSPWVGIEFSVFSTAWTHALRIFLWQISLLAFVALAAFIVFLTSYIVSNFGIK